MRLQRWTKSGLWLGVLVLLIGTGVAEKAQAQRLKVGVVDLQAVLDDSARGKAAKDRLKALGQQLQQEIKSKRQFKEQKEQELQKIREEIRSQGLVLSEQARITKEEEFRKRVRELKRFINDTNNFIEDSTREFREKEVRETQLLLAAVRKVVQEIGAAEKYTLVLEGNENAAVVLFADQSIDITSQIIRNFDRSSASKR